MKNLFRLLTGLVCVGFSVWVQGATFNVVPTLDPDCGDNECDLQSALNAAAGNGEDDVLNLAAGEYDASGGVFAYLAGENKSLTLTGAGADATILDGGGLNQIFVLGTTILAADSAADITFQGISFRNGNASSTGAGLYAETNDADIRIENCDFQSNEMTGSGMGIFDLGGGGLAALAQQTGSVGITGSSFSNNRAPQSNAAGAFVLSVEGDVDVEGNTFIDNSAFNPMGSPAASFGGGAVLVAPYGDMLVQSNLFLDNTAVEGAGGLLTVTVYGTGLITNNVFARNTLVEPVMSGNSPFIGGGGVLAIMPYAALAVTNNTITENRAGPGSGGGIAAILEDESSAQLKMNNNIIWGNTGSGEGFCETPCNDIAVDDDFDNSLTGASVEISYSDFSDVFFKCDAVGAGCTPNYTVDMATVLNVNPVFEQPVLDDFHLADSSPLINKGSSLAPGLPPLDFDGEARVQGGAPDMGAFESAGTPSEPPPTPPPGAETESPGGSGGCSLGAQPGNLNILALLGIISLGALRMVIKRSRT